MAALPAPAPAANGALDVGMTFDTEQSPLFQRIFNTQSVSPLLAHLREDLAAMVQRAAEANQAHWKREASDDDSIVKLYDLSNINSMRLVHVLNWDHFGNRNVFAQEVNSFIRHLRSPMADTHTRIVVLNRYQRWRQSPFIDFERALHLHILIVELEMPIEVAADLLHLCRDYLGPGNARGAAANLWSNILSLGPGSSARNRPGTLSWNVSAADLGVFNMANRPIHTALICSDRAQYNDDLLLCLKKMDPRTQWIRDLKWDEKDTLLDLLNRWPLSDFGAHLFVDEDNSITRIVKGQSTSHWLNALIHTIAFRYSTKSGLRPDQLSRMEDREYELCCETAGTIYRAAKMDLFKIESFLSRHRALGRENCASALHSLGMIVEELGAEYEELSASFERRSTLRSLQTARLSMDESRSTIRLTWLASIFIPISLASSIFGMNVLEIDAKKTSVWQFVVTSIVLLAISGSSWCLIRAVHNYNVCRSMYIYPRIEVLPPLWFYRKLRKWYGLSRLRTAMYFFGFRRVDELKTVSGAHEILVKSKIL